MFVYGMVSLQVHPREFPLQPVIDKVIDLRSP